MVLANLIDSRLCWETIRWSNTVTALLLANSRGFGDGDLLEGIRQYDSCDTGHSDNANIAAEHQEPAEVLPQLDNTSNSPVYGEYKCC